MRGTRHVLFSGARTLTDTLKISTLALLLMCGGFVALGSGCQANRSRPGVSESQGTYQWFAPADVRRTWDAASNAAADLGYTVTRRHRPTGGDWLMVCRDAGSNEITINLEPQSLEATRVAVTIEPGQNQSMSLLVIEAIRQRLPKS